VADVGVAVVGAGVVGLAVAARLAPGAGELVLVERRERHGQETSSRNSEVIHAGLYYPPGSLKARLCVEGNRRLYELCARAGIAHRRTGKIVTAAEPRELDRLEPLAAQAAAAGAPVERLSGAQVRALEPAVRSAGGLLSRTSGIVSAHELMDHLRQVALAAGTLEQTGWELVGLEPERPGGDWRLTLRRGEREQRFSAERVVNAAGLEADRVAERAGIDAGAAGYRQHWARGCYFALVPRRAGIVSRLVYPVPEPESLGVHALIGLDGRVRFGPDIEYLAERSLDYRVDPERRHAFAAAVRRWLPGVADADLSPDIAGIRAKRQGPGEPFRDFVIAEESERGLAGLVDLIGIDSPGLTAAVAIAERVAGLLGLAAPA
jgi:L-2-hydroxyglutarate oxidase LhgO